MPVTPPIKTRDQIIEELNSQGGNWIQLPDTYYIAVPKIEGKMVNYSSPTNGIILTAFLNLQNAEVKTFIAKFLDTPGREDLLQ